MVVAFDRRRDGDLLTLTEAAAVAGVHRNTVRAWCATGRIPSVRVNPRGERRIVRGDVERLMASRRARAEAVVREGRRARASRSRSPQTVDRRSSGDAEEQVAGLRVLPDPAARADALRRIAAEVSGAPDLPTLFEDVLDDTAALFGVTRAGLWLHDGTTHPLKLAIQRGLTPEILDLVATLRAGDEAAGFRALRAREVIVHNAHRDRTTPELTEAYRAMGVASVCFIPVVFQDDPVGLLALYHDEPYDWSTDEVELARSFADGMAAAIGNARLSADASRLARRLHAIQELAIRLNRIQDVAGIGDAIIAEAGRLLEFDTIRVYRVDEATAICEPIAFRGMFMGADDPTPEMLRVPVGTGLTGWVAANNQPIRVADAANDGRGLVVGDVAAPESMLVVPMTFESRVVGVIVVSQLGADRFDADDETTLSIFAGYAAQSLLNAETLAQVRRQRAELEHRLASQRRLLEVNERLLSTLDPKAVLELIADSLKTVVAYDSLTIYRIDRDRSVRRAVVARDRFAVEILQHEGELGVGITGWSIARAEAVLANDAHLDARSVQIPGTPEEPESLIVVPLLVRGDVIGTLNVSRIGSGARFGEDEFELTKLFAGQASIALQNAEAHGEVSVRADHDALTGLRNHGAFQRELGEALSLGKPFGVLMMDLDGFKAFNDVRGHPAGDGLLADVAGAMAGSLRDGDRVYRYGGDEFAVILPGASRDQAHEVGVRIRRAVGCVPAATRGPIVTVSVGVACFPDDGRTKDELMAAADHALYLVKPSSRSIDEARSVRDGYLNALDETAVALMERSDTTTLLETIVRRATGLLGTPHGYLYLVDDATGALVCHVGTGVFSAYLGYELPADTGVGGRVMQTGQPFAVDDYDRFAGRGEPMPYDVFGAVVGVPMTSGDRTVGVIGIASGALDRVFGDREIAALSRFAQLASIALDNARLAEAARRGALYDTNTGLPNRELLVDRLGHALAASGGAEEPIAVLLLDLDRFKVVNEGVGHAVGDRLLAAVARRLRDAVRPADTVARFGGDEFAIILDSVEGTVEAQHVAERIVAVLKAPFELAGREWFLSASVGIALAAPGGGTTPDDVLREAEIAVVRAKADATRHVAVFEPSMSAATRERIELENDLRRAIERDELRVHYQPIVDLVHERVVGVEALVRWEHPTRGLLPPLSFVPLAEETGLIVPLGRWVLETACRQVVAWRSAFPELSLTVSVNLSAREFAQPDLGQRVAEILETTGLPAAALELEITESVLMDASGTGARMLRALRELGVSLGLDDFGTGYSSLSYLKHLPLDTLKIDRAFVTGLGPGDVNLPIVEAVISLAHGLGMGVVAEGIESDAEADALRALRCDLGQGYRWARPTDVEGITALLAR